MTLQRLITCGEQFGFYETKGLTLSQKCICSHESTKSFACPIFSFNPLSPPKETMQYVFFFNVNMLPKQNIYLPVSLTHLYN